MGVFFSRRRRDTRFKCDWSSDVCSSDLIGDQLNTAWSLAFLAKVISLQGDQATARAMYEESLALALAGNSKWHIARGLEGLAVVVPAQGGPLLAARPSGGRHGFRATPRSTHLPLY